MGLVMQIQQQNSDLEKAKNEFLYAQYTALREEIQRRSDFQHQVVAATLIAAGAFFPLGLQFDRSAIYLLFLPLAMFLCGIWAQHSFQIPLIGVIFVPTLRNILLIMKM
jgi:hypothetical protein